MNDASGLSRALQITADRLAAGARYEWGHVGRCNCGHLVQTLTERSDVQILRAFGQELAEWSEHARARCAETSHDVEELFATLAAVGCDRRHVQGLEQLDHPDVLARLPAGERDLRRNERDDVVRYLRAFAELAASR
ncbi:MAG: hypothetical protein IPM29_06280 [Planctomycetes bacterium]|nr:hypothetical protein [Planctomycetota bacterium]